MAKGDKKGMGAGAWVAIGIAAIAIPAIVFWKKIASWFKPTPPPKPITASKSNTTPPTDANTGTPTSKGVPSTLASYRDQMRALGSNFDNSDNTIFYDMTESAANVNKILTDKGFPVNSADAWNGITEIFQFSAGDTSDKWSGYDSDAYDQANLLSIRVTGNGLEADQGTPHVVQRLQELITAIQPPK